MTCGSALFEACFRAHPRSVGETWTQHCAVALAFAALLARAALACLVHALVPALFKSTGSRLVGELNARMLRSRTRLAALGAEPDWAI
jgi:hypothetical protein